MVYVSPLAPASSYCVIETGAGAGVSRAGLGMRREEAYLEHGNVRVGHSTAISQDADGKENHIAVEGGFIWHRLFEFKHCVCVTIICSALLDGIHWQSFCLPDCCCFAFILSCLCKDHLSFFASSCSVWSSFMATIM